MPATKGAAALLLVTATAVASSGCLVGPTYKRPHVPMNARWSGAKDPRVAAHAAIQADWWRTFGDPTLDRLIDLAFHQNLPLQVAGLRILEARAQLGVATGDLLPANVKPAASAAAVGLSDHAANTALVDQHYGEYQVGFDALWEPDFWGKYRRGIRAARATLGATVADYDDALVSLSADVARTYVVIRTFQVLVDLAQSNAKTEEEGLALAQARFQNGASTELDVAQASTLLESTRASIPVLELGVQQAENAMSTLLGQPTGLLRGMFEGSRDIPTPPAQVATGIPAELLRRRPDIRGAELRAIAQCDRIGVAKAELLPQFVLFGSIGTQTSSGGGAPSNNSTVLNLFGPGSLAYNAGVSLLWPLLRYPQILDNVRVQDARYQELLVGYVDAVFKAAQEVEDGMAGYLRRSDAAMTQERAVAASETAVKLALVQYREGAVDYQRVLDAQRALLESQNRLANLRSSAVTDLIALYKAMGGGWEVRAHAPVVPDGTRREMKDRTNWGGYLPDPVKASSKHPR